MKTKSIYLKLYAYIPTTLKKRVYILIPFLSFIGLLEVVSLAALIPLMSFILKPDSNICLIQLLQLDELSNAKKTFLLFGVYLFLMVLKGIFVYVVSKFSFNTSLNIRTSFQKKLFKMYLFRSFIQHIDSNSANYLRNITTECNQLEGRLIMPTITFLAEVLPIIFIISFLTFINPLAVLLSAFTFLVSGFLIAYFTSKHLKKYGKEQLYSDGLQIKIAKEAFSAFKEITLYKRENELCTIYKKYADRSAALIGKALALGQVPKLVLEIIGLIVIAIIVSVNLSNGFNTQDIIIEVTVFMGAIIKLLPSVNKIVMNFQSFVHAKSAVENILDELKNIKPKKSLEKKISFNKLNSIVCRNISVKYKNRACFVIENSYFELTKHNIVGLKGESGSGKSTLINILLGFLKPEKGSIIVNKEFNIESNMLHWQSMISYVPKDVILFDDTLKNNILFYDSDINDKKLYEVITQLRLDSLVDSLPLGLNTLIGENGSLLSGGQKQRVGIARALVRSPEFIIFDEATSALDPETETVINAVIKKQSEKAIVLIIAHKDSAFDICDKVYTIENKKIIELEE